MLRSAAWVTRVMGYLVVGLLTFLNPPAGHLGAVTQTVAFAVLGLMLVAWAVLDLCPGPARAHPAALTVVLAVMAAVTGLAGPAGGGGDSLVAYTVVALLTAGTELPLSLALTVGGVALLAVETGAVLFGLGVGPVLGYPVLLVLGLTVGRNRRAYRVQAEQSAALLEQYERLRSEQRRADVLDERSRIAREIHDVLAHSLGALGIQVQAARALLTDSQDIERALAVLATAQRMASDGLVETRRAVQALRTDTLPLAEELARTAAEHAERHQVAVRHHAGGTPVPVTPEATVALLRTAQEALVNCAKHAPGQAIDLTLEHTGHSVCLTVSNPLGPGPTAPGSAPLSTADMGYGLTGMRERLLLLHGTLQVARLRDTWTVTAEVPSAATRPATEPPAPSPTPPAPGSAT
ncbi:sensor histidine kinase [Kitasatospora sp. NBC_01266]|uniref:sensor histidine kinase n=1 Tax=Kitasatospora sp. NBC_01266 TaxID=2903572 RepID=UPI002E30B25A|nr:histidine kinase [Kitasatospora sp. NBC_01266]